MNFEPDSSCKHCYGRGTIGLDAKTRQPVLCRCVVKKVQRQAKGKMLINPGHLVGMKALYGQTSVMLEKKKDATGGIEGGEK